MHPNHNHKKKGFTLIELLVVISIIGFLSSIIFVSVRGAIIQSRDARRLSDMNQIVKALEVYYSIKKQYPGPVVDYGEWEDPGLCGWDTSSRDYDSDGRPFIEPLIDEGVTPVVPGDPVGTGETWECGGLNYRYYLYAAGSWGCSPVRGPYYVLGVNDMEASAGPYPTSPGWSCSGRNWQNEFDWVTGAFER